MGHPLYQDVNVMVLNLQWVMDSSLTIYTGKCTYSREQSGAPRVV